MIIYHFRYIIFSLIQIVDGSDCKPNNLSLHLVQIQVVYVQRACFQIAQAPCGKFKPEPVKNIH